MVCGVFEKKNLCCFFLVLLFVFCTPEIHASGEAGNVLYHQDFSVVSSVAAAGVTAGTSNMEGSEVAIRDRMLAIRDHASYRVYAILPENPWSDAFTVEFTFCFTEREEGYAKNGSFGVILSCTGEEPSLVKGFIIRVGDGSIMDLENPDKKIGELSEALKTKLKNGEAISVSVPVEEYKMRSITFTADDCTPHTVYRNANLQLTEGGQRGFVVRNAYVSVEEIWVVDGIGYTEKTGMYAQDSYVNDGGMEQIDLPNAPDTGVYDWILLCAAAAAGGVFIVCRKRRSV